MGLDVPARDLSPGPDRASNRLLAVLVYPTVAAAQTARFQAQAREQLPMAGSQLINSDPHVVLGYGPSLWDRNIAMMQTTEAQMERLYQLQNDRDCRINDAADVLLESWQTDTAVDGDFQRALQNVAPNRSE